VEQPVHGRHDGAAPRRQQLVDEIARRAATPRFREHAGAANERGNQGLRIASSRAVPLHRALGVRERLLDVVAGHGDRGSVYPNCAFH
jgi:hypothetical protein